MKKGGEEIIKISIGTHLNRVNDRFQKVYPLNVHPCNRNKIHKLYWCNDKQLQCIRN